MQNKTAYIWGLLSRFAPQGIYLVTTMILARFLTPDDFGTIGVLSIIFVVANVLLDAGLGGSLIKEKYITNIDCSSISVFNMLVSLVIYVTLFLCSNNLERYFGIEGLSTIICTISLVFPFSAFGIVPKSLLNRELRFKAAFINSLIGVIAGSVISIIIAFVDGGIYALVAYQVVTIAVTSIANYISSRYKFSFLFSLKSLKRLLPFGVLTTIISVIDTIYENMITTLTGKYLNVQQAGYLYQAKRIEETMTSSLATTINVVSFPVLTRMKEERDRFVIEADSTFKTIICLTLPLLFLAASFAEEIITLLFGSQWIDSAPYFELLIFAGVFIIMESLIRNFIKSLCEVNKLLIVTLCKRMLGITLLFAVLCISSELMIYMYIFTSFIGFLANLVLYNKLINRNTFSSLLIVAVYALPSVCYFAIMKIPFVLSLGLNGKIGLSLMLQLFIYLFVLRFYGLQIADWIKTSIRKL